MARENVGTLSAVVTADTSEFSVKLAQAETRVDKFSKTVVSSGNALAGSGRGMKSAQMGLLELSRGVEDAASVYGTMGLAGSLRAASNNISQFASLIHPLAGVVAGFATAGLSIFVNQMQKTSDATKEAAKEIRDFTDLVELLDERQLDRAAQSDRVDFGADSDALKEQIKSVRQDGTKMANEVRRQQEEIIALAKPFVGDVIELIDPRHLRPLRTGESPFQQLLGQVDGAALAQVPKEVLERIRDAEREIFKLSNEMVRGADKASVLERAVKAATEREGVDRAAAEEEKRIENQAKRQEQFNDMLEEAARLEKEITAEIDPQASKQAKVLDELDDRVGRIKDLIPAIGQAEADRLIERAEAASDAEMQRLNERGQPRASQGLQLPQAAIRGSAEAISAVNRASMRTGPAEQTAKNTAETAKASKESAKALKKLAGEPTVRLTAGTIA